MHIKKLIVIFVLLMPLITKAQLSIVFTINETPVENTDTLNICRDSLIIFEAEVLESGLPITNATYFWQFDDGIEVNGTDIDSLTHSYPNGGGYRIKLTVVSETNARINIIRAVRIPVLSDFSKSQTDIPEEQDGICLGSDVKLYGKALAKEWEDEPVYEVIESPARLVDDVTIYESVLSFDEFPEGSLYAVGNLDSLGLNIEHSNMGNLEIKLTCPDGNTAVVKNIEFGNDSYLGVPVDDEASAEIGTGFQYWWSNSSTGGTINTHSTNPIPASVYLPDENFDAFLGCSLNGDWKIEVIDYLSLDNGYVFSWTIRFQQDIIPPAWKFQDTLVSSYNNTYFTFWEGTNTTATQTFILNDTIIGISTGTPEVYGNNGYKFHTINSWGCPQDTTISVKAESASFTANPEGGTAKLDVAFTNTTTWADEEQSYWDLGEDNEDYFGIEVNYLYTEKGTYEVILTAISADGCIDTDTLALEVAVEPSKLTSIPNVFTPNDDGINDFYKIDVSGMKDFYISIYSRWGDKVYETEDQEEASDIGWDGRMPITKLRAGPGVYFYVIKAEGKDGTKYEEKGTFQILR